MQRLYRLSFLPLWLFFWGVAILLYWIAWRSGFERDFHGWFEMYYYKSFTDCINRAGMGITSLYQITQLELWFWTKLFGTHLLPWFLLLTGLFSAAGALLTIFLRKFYEDFGWQKAVPIAFWGSLFSLVAPHNAEIVIWKASYHYPVAVLLFSSIWLLLRRALFTGAQKPLWLALLLYAVSTFTLELFYATLPLAILLLALYVYYRKIPFSAYRNVLLALAGMAVLFALHFVLYRAIYHQFIPHRQKHLEAFFREAPLKTTGRFLHNEFNILLQGRYWPQTLRDKLQARMYTEAGGICSLLVMGIGFVTALFYAFRRRSSAPVLWLTSATLIGLLFAMPTEVPGMGIYYNDRLLYFTGLFQWQLLAVLLLRLPLRTALVFSLLLSLALASLTLYTALQCRRSAKVFWRVMETFRWKDYRGKMILLNFPANLKGIVIYQESPTSSELNSHLKIFTGDSARTHLQVVAGYNMEDTADGARVLVENDSMYYVTLIRPGLWYWQGTFGASNHENSLYKMTLDEWTHQYKLELKDTSALLLYFNRGTWKEVDKTRKGVDQE